ncbi:Tyrosyl-DNA phosphodiesterase 2 [Morus notabilis]|uniref:Tyrosyl-DNA phosphodiesterase 2 n=3 Tax=Morus notabilis TaxID=981085 RepID=W9R361_9ROSA|nr:Tyrosyl-DNA phosphodiesterase 2 [Morus notabilis]
MSWACKACTFLNPPSQKSVCQICSSPSSPSSTSSSSSSSIPKWSCKACTFLNPYNMTNCDICDTRAPVSSLSSFEDLNDTDLDAHLDSSIGSVFLPLQPCKRTRISDPVRPEPAKPSSPDLGGGFQAVKLKASDKPATVSGGLELEESGSAKGLNKLKILSYNVWFREDLELQKRMKALGDLIELHSPEVICFQEVTPNIYKIFQQSSWWRAYDCSVPMQMALSRPYFCMQLSKLPVKSFSCRPFGNSIMGRELCVAEIEVQKGKPLLVATSHLESPCPGPPTWDQMFSKERVEQATEALSFLKKNQNVVFGGDMNWDDKLDGQFPLPDGWSDAWANLRPGENGWTYDTKSNQMLSANRTLQKRLDRFVCKLHEFKISGIEMIGMDAIPGLSYIKEKKVKKEIKNLELPVLPSDHYGLLLTICSE